MKPVTFLRGLLLLLLGAFLFLLPVCTVRAADQAIHSINICVLLNQDGSADITEIWDVTVADGTEWYLVQGNLGKIEIENFSVSDETGLVYQNEEKWDVKRSLEEKSGKCGIVEKKDGSYELCFGVGSYGDHVFTITYRMTDFVKGFDDYCGFNQRFINDGLSSNPQRISVKIQKPGTVFHSIDVPVWAFGFDGTIHVTDGAVLAQSSSPLEAESYVNILCRFPRDMFDTTNIVDGSYYELRARAFQGSDYEEPDSGKNSASILGFWKILMILLFAVTFILALLGHKKAVGSVPGTFEESMVLYQKWERSTIRQKPLFWFTAAFLLFLFPPFGIVYYSLNCRKKMTFKNDTPSPSGKIHSILEVKSYADRNASYCRELPLGGCISEIHMAVRLTGLNSSESDVIGAYLLQWLHQGYIAVIDTSRAGFPGKTGKEASSILLKGKPEKGEWIEKRLYDLLLRASGNDGILQEKELYAWAKGHYEDMQEWLRDVFGDGRGSMTRKGYMYQTYKPDFFNLTLKELTSFTDAGKEEILHLYGFRNYLKDFTLMQERDPLDVALWDDYLVAAQLLGMAGKVADSFHKLYPRHFENQASYYEDENLDLLTAISVVHSICLAGTNGAQSGASSASYSSSDGGGGSASSSGGGGYSGGGHGGGSR